jgi:eukaryotic-like serine/threonine-protein kinase
MCGACKAPQPRVSTLGALHQGLSIEQHDTRYVLDRLLGEGAMGVVWSAWRFRDPRKLRTVVAPELVALKFLRGEHADKASKQAYEAFFRNEAEALRRLEHPNVVGFIEVFAFGDSPVLAMEYVDGDTFDKILSRHRARRLTAQGGSAAQLPGLPFQRAYFYFEQLLGALAACHALGIVHRDIKPSNVLVRRDGIAKLTDFGIAEVKRRTQYVASQKPSDTLVAGTSPYMSPEQVAGASATIDGRSDVYSATIVLYELLTGRTPYEIDGKSEWMVRFNHLDATPIPISRFVPQAPPALDHLMQTGLAKDPAKRFQSALAMGEAFRSTLGIPDSPAWHAQAELADEAARFKGQTTVLKQVSANQLQTLRDVVIAKYRTVPVGKSPPR